MSKNIDLLNMNDNFNDQKEKLVSLSHEINLLRQQVNFLLRNEKPLGLLDLDVLMNRTHTIYDTLCAINLGENAENEDLDFDAEAFTSMIGAMMTEETAVETETSEIAENQEEEQEIEPMEEHIPEPEPEEVIPTEPEPVFEPEPEIEPEPEPAPEAELMPEKEEAKEVFQVLENVEDAETETPTATPVGDEYGFFFRFEDIPSVAEEKADEPVEMDDKLVHFVEEIPEDQIPERDLVSGDELVQDDPMEMPAMENPMFVHEEADFELSSPEILADKMTGEDRSLAAKLQQNPVRDLKSVIGINDKFLFVNELFGGSMEKYNKSIENLNDLKTLNGAMIYLNELKIELQWNSSNEAYRKLSDLVVRKFE